MISEDDYQMLCGELDELKNNLSEINEDNKQLREKLSLAKEENEKLRFRIKQSVGTTKAELLVEIQSLFFKIVEHANCKEYHQIDGKQATCLDMVILEFQTSFPEITKEWLKQAKEVNE